MISLAHRTMIDLSPTDLIRTAAGAGFDAVGFPLVPVRDDEPTYHLLDDPVAVRDTVAALAEHGVGVLDVELVRIEPATRAADYRRMFEVGAELGAWFVVAIATDDDESRIATNLAALCAEAAPFGLRVALEFMPRWGVRTLAAAQRIVTAAAHPGASLLVDAAHFYHSGAVTADLAGIYPKLMHYMQINDVADTQAWTKILPGDGNLPLAELMRALPPGIPVSLEVSGPSAEKRDPEHYAQRAAETTAAAVSG
jgi:sugar phosphate isomerase/epimerase